MRKFSDRFRELWNQDDLDDEYEEDEYDEEENNTDYLYEREHRSSARGRRDTETAQRRNKGKRHSERKTRSTEEELEDDFMSRYTATESVRSQNHNNDAYGSYNYQSDSDYGSYGNSSNDYSNTSSGYHKNYDNSTPEYKYSNSTNNYHSSTSSYNSDKTFFDINATTKLRVVCVKPQSYGNDIKYIADQLIENYTILLNFEETPKHDIRSIIDFISGCAYVKHGKVQRIAKNIFIVTPDNVELKGDSLIGELANNGVLIVE